jgi:hypothetical protein
MPQISRKPLFFSIRNIWMNSNPSATENSHKTAPNYILNRSAMAYITTQGRRGLVDGSVRSDRQCLGALAGEKMNGEYD